MLADFVVVGGGIGGAVLAALLGRGGKKVVLLEKGIAPPTWVRPEILWPATMDALFSLRPRETWEQEAVLPMRGVEFHDDQRTVPFITPDVLRDAGVQPWFTNPNQTREQLLQLASFELRRGVEVISVLKDKKSRIVGVRTRDIVTQAEGELLATYTVGDDGGQSLIRKACGIEMETRVFPVDFFCFGCDWPEVVPSGTARFCLNSEHRASGILGLGIFPLPKGKAAGLVPVLSRRFDKIPSGEAWNRFCAAGQTIREVIGRRRFPNDFTRIRRVWGHARQYGSEGAILIGDAAHPVSPAGGQGANMSVADARVLADLALRSDRNLLANYELRRRSANTRSIRATRTAALIFSLPHSLSPFSALFSIARLVTRYPALLHHVVRSTSTMFQEKGYDGE